MVGNLSRAARVYGIARRIEQTSLGKLLKLEQEGLISAELPAYRATRVDPIVTLRSE